MKIQSIQRKSSNFFSENQLLLSENQSEIKEFINLPFSKEALKKQADLKAKDYSLNQRSLLFTTLNNIYKTLPDNQLCLNNINALKNQNCFTITTGHQLSLLTGPIYFIYKIIHILKQCAELNKLHKDIQFVPVYWMAAEDHDFEEIKSILLFGKSYSWKTNSKGAVGRMPIDGIDEVKKEIKQVFQNNKSHELEDWIEKLSGKSYAEAFLNLIHHLFGKYGLLILNADNKELKKSFSPIIKQELNSFFSEKEVLKTNKKLLAKGIKPQVNPREINLFFLSKNKRERIIHDNGYYSIGKLKYTKDELLKLLELSPESFSPNVILRPLYQEFILPNLCYVGGLSEINYWIQLKSCFENAKVIFPILQVRSSLIWINKTTKNKMNAIGINEADIFKPISELLNNYLRLDTKDTIDFVKVRIHLNSLIQEITQETKKVDQALIPYVSAELTRIEKQLEGIQHKLEKGIKIKHEKVLNTINQIKENLFPNNEFQERSLNFLHLCTDGFISKHIETIFLNINPFNSDILILTEDNETK